MELAQESQHGIALHMIAKEMYKTALKIVTQKEKKIRKELMKQAFYKYPCSFGYFEQLHPSFWLYCRFQEAVEAGSAHSLYYLGEMYEKGDAPGGLDIAYAIELFTICASFGSPYALFKLSG